MWAFAMVHPILFTVIAVVLFVCVEETITSSVQALTPYVSDEEDVNVFAPRDRDREDDLEGQI